MFEDTADFISLCSIADELEENKRQTDNIDFIEEKVFAEEVMKYNKKIENYNFLHSSLWLNTFTYKLKSVRLSKNITTISANAFYNCENLANINIPSSITTIGDKAFMFCRKLSAVKLPNSLHLIGPRAFYCCSSLQSVEFGSNLKKIDEHAFSGCNLKTITMGDGVEEISGQAFANNTSLENVYIYNPDVIFGVSVFYNSNNATLHAPSGSTTADYATDNGYPFVAI